MARLRTDDVERLRDQPAPFNDHLSQDLVLKVDVDLTINYGRDGQCPFDMALQMG